MSSFRQASPISTWLVLSPLSMKVFRVGDQLCTIFSFKVCLNKQLHASDWIFGSGHNASLWNVLWGRCDTICPSHKKEEHTYYRLLHGVLDLCITNELDVFLQQSAWERNKCFVLMPTTAKYFTNFLHIFRGNYSASEDMKKVCG